MHLNIKVALLFFIAVVVTWDDATAAEQTNVPDAIYFNGKVVTVDAASSIQEAFAVRGDRFVAVGTDAKILALAGKDTRRVDLDGTTVIPGLSDSHDHLWNASKYLIRGVDMVGVTSLSEMQNRLRAAVATARPGEVVFTTTGWSIQPTPTRKELDQVSTAVAIVVVGSRRGVGVFNGAALGRLGISKANPMFMGVKVPVDGDGEPIGTAPGYPIGVQMVDAALPPLTPKLQDALMKQAMEQRNSLGITSIRELAVWPEAVEALQRMRREGKLTVRIALGIEFPDPANTAKHLTELPTLNRNDPWLFLDSVAEEPWTPGTMPPEEFTQLVREMSRLGWRPAPHVSADVLRGVSADDATDKTLTAYETVNRESPLSGKRWYVEHVPFATPQEMDRMARLGLVISTQDAGYKVAPRSSLPKERMEHQNPIRGFLDHKLVVIGGSDYSGPTVTEKEPNNPLIPYYFYVTRKTLAGEITTPAEKVSRDEALRIFTVNAAYATFQEKMKGQIAQGMLADFVILNQDLMTIPDEKILATRPLATFVGGRKVYAAPGSGF
jgi:predicted amidohydrolase YtcJ